MANGSAMATGHYLGDTGDFQQHDLYRLSRPRPPATPSSPFLENDAVLGDVDEHFGGDYLNEETMLKMARAKGYSTAAIGKVGPTLIFDHTDKIGADGLHSIVIDDATGDAKNGVPLSQEMKEALTKANLPLATPSRGDHAKIGDARTPGTTVAKHHRSRPISPMSPPRSCCRCSRRATSRSCWCSGRAIPTAASTIKATASTP